MKGDFSKWGLKPTDNFSGVLHQQGRVLLDQDWNASTQIQALWKETVGQDVIGDGLVAVPAAEPDGLKILSATTTAATVDPLNPGIVLSAVDLVLQSGRVWVDGVHLHYDGAVPLHAEYFSPPLQSPQESIASIAAGTRDAVVLEVWDEAFSAYQAPLELLEPALGGPDTTERSKTFMAVKLFRLNADQDCGDLPIDDVFANKGKLTVTPAPTTVIAGPCPVPDSGGYTGFEHYLYRIEIATPTATNQARFKWSQFNGGLVGRGVFTAGAPNTGTVAITANNQMINQCGLDSFYLEALAFDPAFGHWRIVCTASATLVSADTLSLTAVSGAWPAGTSGFFRLWNGIELISNHPTGLAIPNPFNDGIRLEFEPAIAGNANYTPGDYWTFPARAASVASNPALWPTAASPEGVHYHRAALGILEWTSKAPVSLTPNNIHDCRQVFLPLAKMKGCCTVTVGDGKDSFGQFKSIQAAVNSLPAKGGTVCVLKGIYDESIVIDKRADIRIHGCGPSTRIRAISDDGVPQPAFLIQNSNAIVLEDMAIEAGPRSAVQIDKSRNVTVRRCLIQMRDLATTWQAIYSRGDDILIQENTIEVLPRPITAIPAAPAPAPAMAEGIEAVIVTKSILANKINVGTATRGGIQLAGGSERVRVLDNLIQGGIWNGITLGSLVEVNSETDEDFPDIPGKADPCDPCKPADSTDDDDPQGGPPKFLSAGDLYDIEISRNRITDMGMNGIGVVRFFDLANKGDLIGVNGLHIYDNFITRCMRRDIGKIREAMEWLVAYGGIALAKVRDLRILRNEIINNGRTHIVPICGVYAIIVQGLQLDDNRILNNGQRSKEPVKNAQSGIRGGVHVWIILPMISPIDDSLTTTATTTSQFKSTARDGSSTVMMRDNIIVVPVGRAVTFFALGSVVVARNRLTTQGSTAKDLDLLATTTLIGNLGFSNEWTLGFLETLFQIPLSQFPELVKSGKACEIFKKFGIKNLKSKPPSFWPPVSRQWATGKTLFTENQVTFDVAIEPITLALSSIAILSLDDVGFSDNQSEVSSTNFFIGANAVLLAGSVRVNDNRFSETWQRALYSGISFGGMNITSHNITTHCLMIDSLIPNMVVKKDNISLIQAFCPNECNTNFSDPK
jgi:hypothetical protein